MQAVKGMRKDLEDLLSSVCIKYGFCIHDPEVSEIVKKDSINAEEFASLVLLAEGMNPEYEVKHFRTLRNAFIEKFGNSVSVEDYK